MSNLSSYRLPMPLLDVTEAFADVSRLEDTLASLHARALWFLSNRSTTELDERYLDMTVYVWSSKVGNGYNFHFKMIEQGHVLPPCPGDAMSMPFDGAWTLREVEAMLKSDNWTAAFLVLGVDHFLGNFTEGSVH